MQQIVPRQRVDDSHLPASLPPKIRQIYASRGISTSAEIQKHTSGLAHFQSLKQSDRAASILASAIQQKKHIVIVGDFDADGATSTALCMLALKAMGSERHSYLVPNRFEFGYGLSPQIVDIAAQNAADVILTVDNGIACFDGVEQAKKQGITVIISDHHLAADRLPVADAIVNPNQPDCGFPSKHLAGVGVAFYLMLALRNQLQQQGWFEAQQLPQPNLASLLDLVALGTVADVVTLDANNRILVHQGLQRMRAGQCRPGIQALIQISGRQYKSLLAADLGFALAPRLNAAGRLDDMSLGIECLLTENAEYALDMASQLNELNRERRAIERSMQVEAQHALAKLHVKEQGLPSALVLYQADFHQGVIGIVAGRIKERYHRPAIVFAHQDDHILKGSARSIAGLHIRDLLEEVHRREPNMIQSFGGHAMAAGLSIKRDDLDKFEQLTQQVATEWLDQELLVERTLTDGELATSDFTESFTQQLQQAGPWGQGFPEPVFQGEFRVIDQKIVGEKHLKMVLQQSSGKLLDGIAFGVDLDLWPNQQVNQVLIAYKLDINEFRGQRNLQLIIQAIQVADSELAG
jgi:single-stranded-DNA-specific exonuclease